MSQAFKAAGATVAAASTVAPTGLKRQNSALKKSGRFMSMRKSNKKLTSHVHVAQSFEGSAMNLFTVKGSAMLSKPVLSKAIAAAAMSQCYYVVNTMRPDNRLENVGSFYFIILGSCLSFLVVFKSNMAYSRFWEARGHIGSILNHTRSFMRRALFSTDLRPGNSEVEEAIDRMQRYLRCFFMLMMQDVRMTQDLMRIPADEKDDLVSVRRRPLMVLGWVQMIIRSLVRSHHITERISMRLEDHLEQMSQAYHGCTKIRSQPMPFSYSQLIAMLTIIYCFSVPITFITSFSYGICVPTFVMALVYFGINHVGTELSDPFGHDTNDIHLEAFLRQIDEDLGCYIIHWTVQPPVPKYEPPRIDYAFVGTPTFGGGSCRSVRSNDSVMTNGSATNASPAPGRAKTRVVTKTKTKTKVASPGKAPGAKDSAAAAKHKHADDFGTDTERAEGTDGEGKHHHGNPSEASPSARGHHGSSHHGDGGAPAASGGSSKRRAAKGGSAHGHGHGSGHGHSSESEGEELKPSEPRRRPSLSKMQGMLQDGSADEGTGGDVSGDDSAAFNAANPLAV